MNCHFCGRSLGLAAVAAGDPDFCSSDHRKYFQARLRKALDLVRGEFSRAPQLAEPFAGFVAVDIPHQPARRGEPLCRLRLPDAAVTIIPDVGPAAGTETAPVSAAAVGTTNSDRLADLGSRLRSLRRQLDRASGVQRRLATV